MSIKRWAKRRDENESQLVKDLRACGFLVRQQDFPDLAIRNRSWPPGMVRFLEVDGITKYRARELKQLQFLREWSIPVVKTVEDALKALCEPANASLGSVSKESRAHTSVKCTSQPLGTATALVADR